MKGRGASRLSPAPPPNVGGDVHWLYEGGSEAVALYIHGFIGA